jgi:predicted transcriptional regulator
MSRTRPPAPTDAELEILQVLWQRGPSTVRHVFAVLQPRRGTGYTTTLKLMQNMAAKGLVLRDQSQRTHVYRPAIAQEPTQRRIVTRLLHRVFAGSMPQLVMHALAAGKASPEELKQIRQLLDDQARSRP